MLQNRKQIEFSAKRTHTVKTRFLNESAEFYGHYSVLSVNDEFMQRYGKDVLSVGHLIAQSKKRLIAGEIVRKNGFIIRKASTGVSYKGRNTSLTLCVSNGRETVFVKYGKDPCIANLGAYNTSLDYLKSIGNKVNGFNVGLVPYHLMRIKNYPYLKGGVLISDFFPSQRVVLVEDLVKKNGVQWYNRSKIGQAIKKLAKELDRKWVDDVEPANCFLDKKTNTLYFFDLRDKDF